MEEFIWSPNLAYAIGLLATDGNLSKDGRHLDLTSKDEEQLENFKKCLDLKIKITWKSSGFSDKRYPRLQFSNVKLYRWLENIGLHPNKTKTIGHLKIPDKFFFDFLRGSFDGDGCLYSYWDPRWHSSYMIYLQFVSASQKHLIWIRKKVKKLINIDGKINPTSSIFQLRYAKNGSIKIISEMYKNKNLICLSRKKAKIAQSLNAGMVKLANTPL